MTRTSTCASRTLLALALTAPLAVLAVLVLRSPWKLLRHSSEPRRETVERPLAQIPLSDDRRLGGLFSDGWWTAQAAQPPLMHASRRSGTPAVLQAACACDACRWFAVGRRAPAERWCSPATALGGKGSMAGEGVLLQPASYLKEGWVESYSIWAMPQGHLADQLQRVSAWGEGPGATLPASVKGFQPAAQTCLQMPSHR